MADQIVPNSESVTVAALNIAWEIVKSSYNMSIMPKSEDTVRNITNAVIKSYTALVSQKPIEK